MTLTHKRSFPRYSLTNKDFADVNPLFFQATPLANMLSNTSATPTCGTDLYETDDAFVLELAVPGIKRDQFEISVEGRQLSIKASYDYDADKHDAERSYHIKTMSRADINRTVNLSDSVDRNAIDAKVEDGILTVLMPKAAEAQARKIVIN